MSVTKWINSVCRKIVGRFSRRTKLARSAWRWLLFRPCNEIGEKATHVSPSGKFELTIRKYETGSGTWAYSRGTIKRLSDGKIMADVKRNYSAFWHVFVLHPNGKEYMLCGEDYQGYNVVDLSAGKMIFNLNPNADKGFGFCWAAVTPAPDGLTLAVDGCYWACPYEIHMVDFSEPEKLPLPILHEFHEFAYDTEGKWEQDPDGLVYVVTEEFDVRASDGKQMAHISDDDEYDKAYETPGAVRTEQRVVRWKRPN